MSGGILRLHACCEEHGVVLSVEPARRGVRPLKMELVGFSLDKMKAAIAPVLEMVVGHPGWVWVYGMPAQEGALRDVVLELRRWVSEERTRVQAERYCPPDLARIVHRPDGATAEIDWPEVRRLMDTDEPARGAAIVLLAAFSQGAMLGQRDGADATPDGLEPNAIPVVLEWGR